MATAITFGFTGPYLIYLADVKGTNTNGGSFLAGADRTRDLNTEYADEANLCTLSSNQFTLLPAKYEYWISAPAYAVDRHQAVLWNVTDGVVVANQSSSSELALAAVPSLSRSIVQGVMTLTASKTFEVRHQCQTNEASPGLGFGAASNLAGRSSIYTIVQMRAWLS